MSILADNYRFLQATDATWLPTETPYEEIYKGYSGLYLVQMRSAGYGYAEDMNYPWRPLGPVQAARRLNVDALSDAQLDTYTSVSTMPCVR